MNGYEIIFDKKYKTKKDMLEKLKQIYVVNPSFARAMFGENIYGTTGVLFGFFNEFFYSFFNDEIYDVEQGDYERINTINSYHDDDLEIFKNKVKKGVFDKMLLK